MKGGREGGREDGLLHIHGSSRAHRETILFLGFRFTYEEARQKCIPRTVPLEFLELSNFYGCDSVRSFYLGEFGSRSTVKKLAIIIRMRAIICK